LGKPADPKFAWKIAVKRRV